MLNRIAGAGRLTPHAMFPAVCARSDPGRDWCSFYVLSVSLLKSRIT